MVTLNPCTVLLDRRLSSLWAHVVQTSLCVELSTSFIYEYIDDVRRKVAERRFAALNIVERRCFRAS